MKQLKLMILAAALLVLLTACGSPAEAPTYKIQGSWDYTFYYEADGGEDTYDLGTFTFEGSDSSGTFVMLNIYEIEYEGSYSVHGDSVRLQTADETIEGNFEDSTHMSGTWSSAEDDASGTWVAVKQ